MIRILERVALHNNINTSIKEFGICLSGRARGLYVQDSGFNLQQICTRMMISSILIGGSSFIRKINASDKSCRSYVSI